MVQVSMPPFEAEVNSHVLSMNCLRACRAKTVNRGHGERTAGKRSNVV